MMRHFRTAVRVLAIAAACIVLTAAPAAAQADVAAADGYAPARTPWGHPDLQGIWDSKTQTPLERPAEFADKEFLTAEEVAALERQTIENAGRDERAEAGTVADVEGAYNNAFSTFYATRVVETGRTSLIVDPPDGKIPYTAAGRQRVDAEAERRQATREDADGPEDRPSDRCLGFTLPCTSPLCAFSRIVQTPDSVTLYYEAGHWGGAYRTIPLDGRPHGPAHVRQWHGDARGRWEGDTLVVDTTNFASSAGFQGAGEQMQLVERFSRVADDLLMYHATIADEATFAQPWTIEMTWRRGDNKQNLIYESACHEGNYALTSILAGARVLEGAR
ncbi:MAG: hypothetical protein OXF27_18495 [Acidobacteria bacterium]|nr:hypothetical protein [Acidobacteriota bacterium]